ncbi:MAG: hypothetical protein QXL02_02010 [Candidatus Anstonellales archaeon]
MKSIDLILIILMIMTILSIRMIYEYNQYYAKNYVELEKYINTIYSYLQDKYSDASRIELLSTIESNDNIKVSFALIFNDTSFYPKRYHVDYIYPDYKFAEIDPYIITLADCSKNDNNCRLIYPEEVIYNLGIKKPHLRDHQILKKELVFDNDQWLVDLELDGLRVSARVSISGDLLYYSETP